MSVEGCTILAMTQYYKYTWVCTGDCDALIEYTFKDGFGWPTGALENTCPCKSKCTLVSVEPVTITPTNERETMETKQDDDIYNPNALITYKVIENGMAQYKTIKATDLDWAMSENRRQNDRLNNLQSQVNKIIDNLTATNWFGDSYDKQSVLNELCGILDHEAKQSVTINATISVELYCDVPIADVEDFDARYFVEDALSIDSYNGDIEISSWHVDDSDVDWN